MDAFARRGSERRLRRGNRRLIEPGEAPPIRRVGVLGLVMAVLASTLVVSAGTVALVAAPAAAAPGSPGTPSAGEVIYNETFDEMPADPILRLNEYVGVDGQTYTADQAWLERCNGWIAQKNQPASEPDAHDQIADCTDKPTWNLVQDAAQSLGMFHGQAPDVAADNFALSAWTAGDPGGPYVELETETNIPLVATTGRYLASSVDVSAGSCHARHPLLQFSFIDGDGTATPLGDEVDACATGRSITTPSGAPFMVGTYYSGGAILWPDSSVGVRIVNNQTSGGGNDHAVDNLRIVDVTPQLDKGFSPESIELGQTSTLTFTITNTEDRLAKDGWSFTDTLPTGLVVADPTAADTTCSAGSIDAVPGGTSVSAAGNLDAGQDSCTFSVSVRPTELGSYTNDADNITSIFGLNKPNPSTLTATSAPALTIDKTATPASIATVGDVISYEFLVTNTGNVPLTNVSVTDAQAAPAGDLDGAIVCPETTLAVGASTTCTASYTTTQDDMNHGQVMDTAFATGTDPYEEEVDSEPDTVTVPMVQDPTISVDKSASETTFTTVGQEVDYTFEVANTGNVPLTNLTLTDPFDYSSPISCSPVALGGTLPLGGTTTCAATYTVTLTDLNNDAALPNTVTAAGTPPVTPSNPEPTPVTDEDTETISPDATPSLQLRKSADPTEVALVDDQVTYTFDVTNTGNQTVTDIAITEVAFSGTGELSEITCAPTSLDPTQVAHCAATYSVTQADVDSGSITNTAQATGLDPAGEPVESNESSAAITADADPSITVVKTADVNEVHAAGDEIGYSFLVTNTGNVTLTDVGVDETAFSGTGDAPEIVCEEGLALAPGEDATCTATYTVTQADIDSGEITNTATSHGVPPGTDEPVESEPSEETVDAPADPSITIVKSADVDEVHAAGEEIGYSFLVTNTGNVALTDVGVDETAFSGTGDAPEIVCEEGLALAPGEDATCTATYTVTQADIDSGEITNTATSHGMPPRSEEPVTSEPSDALVTAPAAPAIAMVKAADVTKVTSVGQVITYTFTITNTGNVSIADAGVIEGDFTGHGTLATPVCADEPNPLAPGDVLTCTTMYAVVAADLTGQDLVNTATATGTPPGECAEDGACPSVTSPPATAKVQTVTPPLATTGGSPSWIALGGGTLLLLAGGALLFLRRRKLAQD